MTPIAISALLAASLALAPVQDVEDDPGAGVARLSVADGDVIVQRGDTGELIAAERNAPLVALDHVITGQGARAEIQFDSANMLRLAENSEVRLAELADGDFFIQVAGGTVTFSVLTDSSTLVELSTPTASLRPLEQGLYRLYVRTDGTTEVSVRSGSAELFTALQNQILTAGMTIDVRGNPDNPQLVVLSPLPLDAWDQWNRDRDRDLLRSDVYQYVSRDVYGAEDLNNYGRWVYDAPYGYVWVPDVSSTWAPYRVGRWSWVDYYGWTWVSGDPWGWAPYHYGRWYHAPRYGWVWYPGTITVRQYWRPALVAFFGWGSGGSRVNVSLSFGFGNVGWVPLAPYEVYRPWYGRRNGLTINNVTVVNNVNIINNYRNARFVNGRNGVTSIRTRDFGVRTVSDNNIVRVGERDLSRAGEVRGRVPLDPLPESRRLNEREVNTRAIARRNVDDTRSVRRAENGPPDNSRVAQRADVASRAADVRARAAAQEPRDTAQESSDTRNGRGANRPTTAQAAPAASAGNSRAQQRESVAARGADNDRRTLSNTSPAEAGNGRGGSGAARSGQASSDGTISVVPSPRRAEPDAAPAGNNRAAQRSSVATRSGRAATPVPTAPAVTTTAPAPRAAPDRRAPESTQANNNSRAAERSSVATRSGGAATPTPTVPAPQASAGRRATQQAAPRQSAPAPQAAPERRAAPQSAPANNSRAAQRGRVTQEAPRQSAPAATRRAAPAPRASAPASAPQAAPQRQSTPRSAPASNSRAAQRGNVTQQAPRQSAPATSSGGSNSRGGGNRGSGNNAGGNSGGNGNNGGNSGGNGNNGGNSGGNGNNGGGNGGGRNR